MAASCEHDNKKKKGNPEITSPVEQLSASQAGHCSMEYVYSIYVCVILICPYYILTIYH
jgi:hypothetical protein